ncbi:hypothetical protein ACELLULO517_04550 [Acidisoma cellulosilytica]|uniref:Uncharacterized protein n=1 Tax=Acidisoma cellulosilyticum TaxID=2802395 RepID=A0A963YZZ9_9PROT|nr:hypothetical protein [Acidisoma cellulosilyticum]MCB8879492.1 hypothetical protein [Acidisoma cellulosilyticum]
MALQDQVEMASLRNAVMAALSDGQRRSAHPADQRLRQAMATRIALAIQAEFMVFGRQAAESDAQPLGNLLLVQS